MHCMATKLSGPPGALATHGQPGKHPRCSAAGSGCPRLHPWSPAATGWPCHSRSPPRPGSHSLVLGQAQPKGLQSHRSSRAEGAVTTSGRPAGVEWLPHPSCASGAPGAEECGSHWPGSPHHASQQPRATVSHGPVTVGTAPVVAGSAPATREQPRQAAPRAASVLPRGQAAHRGPKITDAAKHVLGSAQFPARGRKG